jgi:hypothetical protein
MLGRDPSPRIFCVVKVGGFGEANDAKMCLHIFVNERRRL